MFNLIKVRVNKGLARGKPGITNKAEPDKLILKITDTTLVIFSLVNDLLKKL